MNSNFRVNTDTRAVSKALSKFISQQQPEKNTSTTPQTTISSSPQLVWNEKLQIWQSSSSFIKQ